MAAYDFFAEPYPIEPPVGPMAWGAKAKVKKVGTGRSDDFITLREHLGRTADEARTRALAEAKEWIAAQKPT